MYRSIIITLFILLGCTVNKKYELKYMVREDGIAKILTYEKTSLESSVLDRKIIAEYPMSNKTIDVDGIFYYLEPSKEAEFSSNIKQFIKETLEIPEKHNEGGAFCLCYAFISKKGKLMDYGIIKPNGRGYDKKAVAYVSKMKKWLPAQNEDGVEVNSLVYIFIKFPLIN